jgi:hypothetical protein
VLIIIAVFIYHAPLEHHADPQITPLHTTAPWYFLWLQGLLKLGDPGLMGVVLPSIIGVVLLAVPYFDIGPSRRYADRRIGITMGLLFSAVLVVLTFMGTPRYLVQTSADQEIMQNALPQEGVGPLRSVPFDDLVTGTYEIRAPDTEFPNAPASLQEALDTVREDTFVTYTDENWPSGGLKDGAYTVVAIEDWQPGLKKITITVVKDPSLPDDDANRASRQSAKTGYVHADANYAGGH